MRQVSLDFFTLTRRVSATELLNKACKSVCRGISSLSRGATSPEEETITVQQSHLSFLAPRSHLTAEKGGLPSHLREKLEDFSEVLHRALAKEPLEQEAVPGWYGIKKKQTARRLEADHLALPKIENTPVPFYPWLSPELAEELREIDRVFSDACLADVSSPTRASVLVARPEEYPKILMRLKERQMIRLVTTRPKLLNGMFGVAKGAVEDPLSRFITNAVPTNEHTFPLKTKLRLPDPSVLNRLPAWVQWVAATDIESYYNTMLLPNDWGPYMGFPRVEGYKVGESAPWVWPVSGTLPMGWTHSVLVGQDVHENVIKAFIEKVHESQPDVLFVNLQDEQAVLEAEGKTDRAKIVFYLVYVDDISLFGQKKGMLDDLMFDLISHYEECGFPVKASKTVFGSRELRVLGVWVDLLHNIIRPVDSSLAFLYRQLPLLVKSKGPVRLRVIQSMMGKILWPALLFRPLLSIFQTTYVFINKLEKMKGVTDKMTLWPSVRRELQCFGDLLPLVQTSLVPASTYVVATDATGTNKDGLVGYGVAYARNFPTSEYKVMKWSESVSDQVEDLDWKWAIATSCASSHHVHIQEMLGLLTQYPLQ